MLSSYSKQILEVLIQLAKDRQVISYTDLATKIGRPGETLAIPNALGRISEYTYQELGIFISVLVVNGTKKTPGSGFLQLAANSMGLEKPMSADFCRRHLKTVFAINHKELDSLMI